MAINRQEILDTFHGGEGAILAYPIAPIADLQEVFIPVEELPAEVREIYTYNPDKARQLLADAWYPTGFKTSITCWKPQVDLLSMVAAYWADIGVELEIDQKEHGVYQTLGISKKEFPELYAGPESTGYSPWWWGPFSPGGSYNYSVVNDPAIVEARKNVEANYWDEPAKFAAYKEILPYLLGQAYYVPTPDPVAYTFWQPWLKCYGGELDVGYYMYRLRWAPFVWIDQDLKYEMTGRR
jgi:peptide/nickel transport system substrate-binding protein